MRKSLLLSLDDLLAVTREFLARQYPDPACGYLRRHGVGNLRQMLPKTEKTAHKPFKAYPPGSYTWT